MNAQRHDWFLQQVFGHRQAVSRYLRRFRLGEEDSEDVLQEGLLRMYALPDTGSVQSPRAMLFSIVHNLAVERLRRTSGQATDAVAEIEALDVFSSEAGPEQQADASDRFKRFCAIVAELPPVCRRAFVLRKIYGLSPEE
ncbi:MAG: sigma-70 family RNA polymerase sigma factor, partial [Proteobacteria bacterium]|nr:sigma-70 family RNA polymerase sigma factor [Pseudomonadota bacterium]